MKLRPSGCKTGGAEVGLSGGSKCHEAAWPPKAHGTSLQNGL